MQLMCTPNASVVSMSVWGFAEKRGLHTGVFGAILPRNTANDTQYQRIHSLHLPHMCLGTAHRVRGTSNRAQGTGEHGISCQCNTAIQASI